MMCPKSTVSNDENERETRAPAEPTPPDSAPANEKKRDSPSVSSSLREEQWITVGRHKAGKKTIDPLSLSMKIEHKAKEEDVTKEAKNASRASHHSADPSDVSQCRIDWPRLDVKGALHERVLYRRDSANKKWKDSGIITAVLDDEELTSYSSIRVMVQWPGRRAPTRHNINSLRAVSSPLRRSSVSAKKQDVRSQRTPAHSDGNNRKNNGVAAAPSSGAHSESGDAIVAATATADADTTEASSGGELKGSVATLPTAQTARSVSMGIVVTAATSIGKNGRSENFETRPSSDDLLSSVSARWPGIQSMCDEYAGAKTNGEHVGPASRTAATIIPLASSAVLESASTVVCPVHSSSSSSSGSNNCDAVGSSSMYSSPMFYRGLNGIKSSGSGSSSSGDSNHSRPSNSSGSSSTSGVSPGFSFTHSGGVAPSTILPGPCSIRRSELIGTRPLFDVQMEFAKAGVAFTCGIIDCQYMGIVACHPP